VISSIVHLLIGIPSTQKDKQFNHNQKKWPKNDSDAENDPYEVIVLTYNREMNELWMMLTWKWTMSST
jgi:hypothetical protein